MQSVQRLWKVGDEHSSAHFDLEKTISILKRFYWFKLIWKSLKRHISSCVECLFNKEKGGVKGIELSNWESTYTST